MAFLSGSPEITAPVAPPAFDDEDQIYWQALQAIGTSEALQSYVERYPQGQYALQAKQMIRTLQAQP